MVQNLIQMEVWDERKTEIRLGNALYAMYLLHEFSNTCL